MNKDWQMCQVIGTLYLVYFTKVWTVLLLQHDAAVCTELLYKFLSNVIFCNVVSARIILCKTLKKKCTAFPYCLINLGFLFFLPLGLGLVIDFWSFIKRSDWLYIRFSCGILMALFCK